MLMHISKHKHTRAHVYLYRNLNFKITTFFCCASPSSFLSAGSFDSCFITCAPEGFLRRGAVQVNCRAEPSGWVMSGPGPGSAVGSGSAPALVPGLVAKCHLVTQRTQLHHLTPFTSPAHSISPDHYVY